MKWINLYAENFYECIYEYLSTLLGLLFSAPTTIKHLIDENYKGNISAATFFFINITVLEAVGFLFDKNVSSFFNLTNSYEFMLPIIGGFNPSHILNIIGYYVGNCLVVLCLTKCFNCGSGECEKLKKVFMYSSGMVLIIGILNSIVLALVVSLVANTSDDFSLALYRMSNYDSYFISSYNNLYYFLDVIKDCVLYTDAVCNFVYIVYMCVLLKQFTFSSMAALRKVIMFLCTVVLVLVSTYMPVYKVNIVSNEIATINSIASDIREIVLGKEMHIEYEKILAKNPLYTHNVLDFKPMTYISDNIDLKELETNYKELANERFLPAQERLELFKRYFIIKNIEKLSKDVECEHKVIVYGMLNDTNLANTMYGVVSNNVIGDDKIMLSKIDSAIQIENKKYGEYFPCFIYLQNVYEKYSVLFYPLSFFGSLINLFP